MLIMIKRALKSAIGVSVGVMISNIIITRFLLHELYNSTNPSVGFQVLQCLLIGYITGFLIFFVIELIKSKARRDKA